LYYCSTDMYTVDHDPVHICCHQTAMDTPPPVEASDNPLHCFALKFVPISRAR
jgi:hypothetical protein